jgi:glucose/arabinose dehydrogenase
MLRAHVLSAAAAALTLAAPLRADPPLKATLVTSGLALPTDLTAPPGDSARIFVTEQGGRVRLILNGVLQATPFLDISALTTASGEQGLLGLAFHPDYANNRKFYVSYTQTGSGSSVVRQYLRDAVDPNVADPASFTTIIGPIPQPFTNHNGGNIKFGPDGFLYYGLGDGGSANDPGNRAQTLTNVLGKMHRLDVDNPPTYVAAGNPFIGPPNDPGNVIPDTIWAYGLRNPWRYCFDRATGDLYIADVGQSAVEEIDFQPASSAGGENYGWHCMEGNTCTGLGGCTCFDASLTEPIFVVTHAGGNCSITGGYVYRGNAIPGLQGTYFFADYCSQRVWSLRYDPVTQTTFDFTNHTPELAIPGTENISSFGEDADGEIYIVDQAGGEIWRIEQNCVDAADCIQTFCDSTDVALNDCPCSNPGNPDSGCDISQGTGGVKLSVLAQDTATPRATLQGTGFPAAGNPGAVIIRSPVLDPSSPVVFGDGLRCIGVPLVRLGATIAAGGSATHVFGHGAAPGVYYYQEWFRNTPIMFCDPMAEYNLSNGVSLLWP